MNIEIKLKQNGYSVVVDSLKTIKFDKKVAIITNPTIGGYHLNYLLSYVKANEIKIITVPDGEKYKNLNTIEIILENLFNSGFNRD